MTGHAIQGKQKFFFDINIFDEKEEPTEPPPPMFTAAEVEAARREGFATGHAQALQESADSREQYIAKVLEAVAKNVTVLFTAETMREKTFEQESVKLCLAVFQRAFPLYQEKFGHEELQRYITSILKRHEGQKQVVIHVQPVIVDGINQHLAKIRNATPDLNFSVQGDETLAAGACRLSWSDGGAVRNPAMLAGEIEAALKELLAGAAAKVHDG